jgi:Calcium-activated chloride channel
LIQFGYTTLFASAYPLASLVSVAANYVEIRSDLFKLSYLDQRPFPTRSSDLGIWRSLLSCLVWMSALTNCLLAGFTSDQLMHYLPTFYLHDRSGYTTMEHDRGWLLIFVIFGLERLLLVLGMLLYVIVPDVPEDVTDELERRHYVHDRRMHALQSSRRLKKDN